MIKRVRSTPITLLETEILYVPGHWEEVLHDGLRNGFKTGGPVAGAVAIKRKALLLVALTNYSASYASRLHAYPVGVIRRETKQGSQN
jgi:hypothetical protein